MNKKIKPKVGLMLIRPMHSEIERLKEIVDFFQVPGEDFFGPQAVCDYDKLSIISKTKPLHIHSIDLSLGSADGVNKRILNDISYVANNIPIVTFSDHIGFSKVGEYWTGMPILNLPLNTESINLMSKNILEIRKVIGNKSFYIENNSHCIEWPNSKMKESEFVNSVVVKSDAKILLDIPNMLADSRNYNFDPFGFIDGLISKKVEMVHLAGGDWLDGYSKGKITRGHNKLVEDDTWRLFNYVLKKCDVKYVVLERSRDINYEEIALDISKIRLLLNK